MMETQAAEGASAKSPDKVVNLAVYKIKRSLRQQGFDLRSDEKGKLTLVLRLPKS